MKIFMEVKKKEKNYGTKKLDFFVWKPSELLVNSNHNELMVKR